MRVGIDYRPALVSADGIGRYVRELVRALVELGFDSNLGLFGYTLARKRFRGRELGVEGSGAELLRLRVPSRWMPRLLARLEKGVDDLVGGCDVYHHTQYSRLAVRLAREVATVHDCIWLDPAGWVAEETAARMEGTARSLVRDARRVLVPSEFVAAEVVLKLGAWPNRIVVAPLGCDHVARAIPPEGFPSPRDPYVLTVSRVEPRKNHLRVLAAFERLVAGGLPHRWIVAGAPGYAAEDFARALDRSPARERVEWRRRVPDAELPRLYAGADLLLFPSLAEGFGLPVLEAMAAGTAVVTSAISALPEAAGGAALLVEPSDPDAIHGAAHRLLTDADLRRDHERRGRDRARRAAWRETARQALLAYQAASSPEEEEGPKLRRSL